MLGRMQVLGGGSLKEDGGQGRSVPSPQFCGQPRMALKYSTTKMEKKSYGL